MDRQGIFDKVVKHLLTQNRKAQADTMMGRTMCMYLTPDGNKCAIGCLIPDGHPGQSQEGTVHDLFKAHPDLAEMLGAYLDTEGAYFYKSDRDFEEIIDPPRDDKHRDVSFLSELQKIHDYTSVANWPSQLQAHAERWGLKYEMRSV